MARAAGVGGGGFIVPFLPRVIDMKKAIGSSAFCGATFGLSGGMLSFMVSGWVILPCQIIP